MSRESIRRVTQLFSISFCLLIIALSVISLVPVKGFVDEAGYARVVTADSGGSGMHATNSPSGWRYGDCYIQFFLHNLVVAWVGGNDFTTWSAVEEVSLIVTTTEYFSTAMDDDGQIAYVVTENDADTDFYYRTGQVNSDCTITWDGAEQNQATNRGYAGAIAKYPSIDIDDGGDLWIGVTTGTATPRYTEIWECVSGVCTLMDELTGSGTQAMPVKLRTFSGTRVAYVGMYITTVDYRFRFTDDGGATWTWGPVPTTEPYFSNWNMFDAIVVESTWYHVVRGSAGNNFFGIWPFGSGFAPTEVDFGHAYGADSPITFLDNLDFVVGWGGLGYQWSEDNGLTWSAVYEMPGVGGSDMSVQTFVRAPRGLVSDRGVAARVTGGDLQLALFKITTYATGGGGGASNQVVVGGTTHNDTGWEMNQTRTYFYCGKLAYPSTAINITSLVKNVTNPTYSWVVVRLGVYVSKSPWSGCPHYATGVTWVAGAGNEFELKSSRAFVILNNTFDQQISFNPAVDVPSNHLVLFAISTMYTDVFLYLSPTAGVPHYYPGHMPAIILGGTVSPDHFYLFGILQYMEGAQVITTTVTTTLGCTTTATVTTTSTRAISPTLGVDVLPMLIVFALLILLPPLIFAYYIGVSGIFLGLAIGCGIGVAIGVLPFWFIIAIALAMTVTLVLRSRGIGSRGD